jgi:hypothetical protein
MSVARHLLKIDAQHVDDAEGHSECDRYRQSHDQCQSPLPEANERDDHDQDDRFVQRTQEEVNVLLYL